MAGHAMPRLTTGNWQSRLLTLAQIVLGVVAALGVVGVAMRSPLVLLAFLSAQGLVVVGVVLFVIVAVTAQRGMVVERYGAGEIIVRAGDATRDVYVVKSGTAEAATDPVTRLGPGDHFADTALLGTTSQPVTVRAVTAVEVLKLTPSRFVALYTSLPELRASFKDAMAARMAEPDARK